MKRGFRKSRLSLKFSKRGLILCEGETEENYFKGLITQERYRRKFSSIDVKIFKPKDHSPLGLVNESKLKIKEAKREKNPYDFVWVIFDRDGHAKIPEAFEIARTSKPEIKIIYTKPCFEYYVLLHFEKTTKPFYKCDDVISYINEKYKIDYKKASNLFDLLLTQKETGTSNSNWVVNQFADEIEGGKKIYELSAFSNVHELVEYLYSLL